MRRSVAENRLQSERSACVHVHKYVRVGGLSRVARHKCGYIRRGRRLAALFNAVNIRITYVRSLLIKTRVQKTLEVNRSKTLNANKTPESPESHFPTPCPTEPVCVRWRLAGVDMYDERAWNLCKP